MLVNLHKKCVANTDFYLKNLLNKSLTTALQSCLIYSTISSKSDENHDKPKYSYIWYIHKNALQIKPFDPKKKTVILMIFK